MPFGSIRGASFTALYGPPSANEDGPFALPAGEESLLSAVGYTTHKLWGNDWITWAVATVQDMSNTAEEQTIGSFKIPTDQEFQSGSSIVLEIWGNNGKLVGSYSFCDEKSCGDYGLTDPGWYPLDKMESWDVSDEDLSNGVQLPFGYGVVITSGEADSTLTFAGQVLGEKTYKIWGNDWISWVGNASPVDLKLKDFAIPADQEFQSGSSIVLEIWGNNGKLVGSYSFCDEKSCGDYGLTDPGWYPLDKMESWDVSDEDLMNEKVTIYAGQMVVITSGEADTTLTIPDPMTVTPSAAE